MDLILFLLFCIVFAIGGSWLFHISGKKKSLRLLQEWASRQGVELLQIEEPPFDAGPFTLRCSKVQRVFRLHVASAANERVLWVRLGSFWLGSLKPDITVEEEPISERSASP